MQDTNITERDGVKWPEAQSSISSFDGGIRARATLQRPDRYRFWDALESGPRIARGAGLSYAAASFREGGLSVEHTSFDRVLDFDGKTGVVEVESGISLNVLHKFLAERNLYLKIQPGYGRITVGGCIASDVHGKNQFRDGTFIDQVAGLTLFHPARGFIDLNSSTEPDLFRLTCGGYGLTGHIIKARLRANPIPSNLIEMCIELVPDAASGVEKLKTLATEADFVYSWHDFNAAGISFGKGFICAARFSSESRIANSEEHALSLSASNRSAWRLPLLNRWTSKILNAAYLKKQEWLGKHSMATLHDALFPIHSKQLYFKLFGAPGFHEYQAIIPTEAVGEYTRTIREYLIRRPIAITLASGKMFRGEKDLLRFTGDGFCLALNFPRTSVSGHFLSFLDELVVSVEGIPNIIKDSRLPLAVIEACYPGVHRFRDLLHAFDPERLFRSELSDRLRL